MLRSLLNDSIENQSSTTKPETTTPAIEQKNIQLKEDSIVLASKIEITANKEKIVQLQPDSIVQMPDSIVPVSEEKIMRSFSLISILADGFFCFLLLIFPDVSF